MEEMTIGEVARAANIKTSTLRYYESIGLLPPPSRKNGQRRYDSEVGKRLSVIHMAKEAGFTLREIKTLMSGFSDDTPPSVKWKTLATKKLIEIEAMIARANAMKMVLREGMECDCLNLDECAVYFNRKINEQIQYKVSV